MSGAVMAGPICRQRSLVLALGTISPPSFGHRRIAQRHTWMRWPNVGTDGAAAVCSVFVVRAGGPPPPRVAATLARESKTYRDVLLADAIAWNETRVRGPVLSLAWWLDYAARELTHALFVGKVDDDTYLHAVDVEALLRATHAQVGSSASVYLGVLTWYHWYPRLFEVTRHSWSHQGARSAGKWCRGNELNSLKAHVDECGPAGCGRCVGPFPFASGFLLIVSHPLARALASAGGGLPEEVVALRRLRAETLPDKAGNVQTQVMEDVWLGSVLYRYPPRQPITYVTLLGGRGGLHVDTWDLRLTRSALLVHNFNKVGGGHHRALARRASPRLRALRTLPPSSLPTIRRAPACAPPSKIRHPRGCWPSTTRYNSQACTARCRSSSRASTPRRRRCAAGRSSVTLHRTAGAPSATAPHPRGSLSAVKSGVKSGVKSAAAARATSRATGCLAAIVGRSRLSSRRTASPRRGTAFRAPRGGRARVRAPASKSSGIGPSKAAEESTGRPPDNSRA